MGPSWLSILSALALAVLGTLSVTVFLWSKFARRRLLEERKELSDRLARAETQAKEQSRLIARMRTEQSTLSRLDLILPEVVKELNRSETSPSEISRMIVRLAEAIFQPGQLLFYEVPRDRRERELVLTEHRGLSDVPAAIRSVPFGHGKIGWVAAHRCDMMREDWLNLARTEGETVVDNHATLALDIVGPLVHYGRHEDEVLGVLCIGSPSIHPRDQKLMFKMLSNLACLALVNLRNVSRLREQANHDGLTGLWNRKYFGQKLREHIAGQGSERLSVFIFDIDHFKNYNDTNGHPAGDELLRQLALLLRKNLRESDWCCRYGGEEFLVAMRRTDEPEARQVAERVRKAIADYPFPFEDKQPGGDVTISGGIAVAPYDGDELDVLIEKADAALYQSKQSGRNRVIRYRGIDIGSGGEEDPAIAAELPLEH
ncbi:MAG TPA: sensor domain-containing diguanylate cyclase [Candidatus Polarisedimenticolaceae bacterium]|nr:sensor domain-containing diguanylate cyclase [Candidatus Polarisedimenticolaceae bacterium]